MNTKLRPYQVEASRRAVENLQKAADPFIVEAATGAGKSLIIADIAKKMDGPGLVLQPSKEILEQNFAKFKQWGEGIDAGIYSASVGTKDIGHVTFATIGSIKNIPDQFKHVQWALLDECHLLNPKNQQGMLTKFFKETGIRAVCGLTATPYRLDILWEHLPGGYLQSTATLKMINRITRTPFFKSIVYQIETAELIDQGYLSPVRYFSENISWADLKINSTGADFTAPTAELFARKRSERILAAVSYANVNHKRSLTFCGSIEQAETARQQLADAGIRAEVVTGTSTKKVREGMIAAYKAGDFKHMLNVGVFTTGFDMPILDCVILAKPTMSLALYYQMVGRGIRLDPDDPKKILSVYDLAGIVPRLGRVETIRVQKEPRGYKDEVHTEVGRMDGYPLYSFTVPPKEKDDDRGTR